MRFRHCAALALLLLPYAAAVSAQEVQQLDRNATSKQMIDALKPQLKYRGLKVLNSNPAQTQEVKPSIAIDIRFALNSASLTPDAKATLKQIGDALRSPDLSPFRFQLVGHTDVTGNRDYNLKLSTARANSVRDYLVATYRIEPQRLEALGRGQEDLLDPKDPTSAVNRRVQITNLGN